MAITTDVEKLRLEVGDDPELPILSDEEYEYILDKNSNNMRRSALEAARIILFRLARYVHERVDILEVRGNQWAEAYRKALELFISNPSFSVATQMAQPYAGGISKADIRANLDNQDNYVVDINRSQATSDYNSDNPYYKEGYPRNDPFGVK